MSDKPTSQYMSQHHFPPNLWINMSNLIATLYQPLQYFSKEITELTPGDTTLSQPRLTPFEEG